MDEKDKKIIEELKEDGRKPFTDIAGDLGVSEATVRNRVRKMEEEGEIECFTVKTSTGEPSAIVMVKLKTSIDIEEVIEEMPEGIKVNEVTGEHDLVVEFSRSSSTKINDLIDNIRSIDGVIETKTHTVLKSTRK